MVIFSKIWVLSYQSFKLSLINFDFSIAKIDKYFDFAKYKNKILKKININKFSQSNYSIILSRYIFPYFFHNIYYGILNIKLKKFFLLVILSEIPMLYALNSIGKSMINFDFNILYQFLLYFLIKFYIPFIIIFVIFILTSYLYKIK